MMYQVSILVPIYNVEKYIERCARSLFEQTYENLECVFVDDASQDQSLETLQRVIEDYPKRKTSVTIVRNNKNMGSAASRNILMDHAKGSFVCFVDADDWLEQNAVELLVRKQQEKDSDLVYGKAYMHSDEGLTELSEPQYKDKNEMLLCYSRFTSGYTMVLWRRLIRKDLLVSNNIREIEGFNYAEDKRLLTLLAYYLSSFAYLDEYVYHYNRQNDHSLVIKVNDGFNKEVFRQEIGNLQSIVDFFKDRDAVYYKESSIALLCFMRDRMEEALQYASRDGFYEVVKHIKTSPKAYWDEIGWNTWKRCLYGNYFYMKYFKPMKRKVKHIFRRS